LGCGREQLEDMEDYPMETCYMVCSVNWNSFSYEYYFLSAVATAFAVGMPWIPHMSKLIKKGEEE
jgi:hypothetical protein